MLCIYGFGIFASTTPVWERNDMQVHSFATTAVVCLLLK